MSAITNKTKRSMDRYVEKENQKQKRLGVSENEKKVKRMKM